MWVQSYGIWLRRTVTELSLHGRHDGDERPHPDVADGSHRPCDYKPSPGVPAVENGGIIGGVGDFGGIGCGGGADGGWWGTVGPAGLFHGRDGIGRCWPGGGQIHSASQWSAGCSEIGILISA